MTNLNQHKNQSCTNGQHNKQKPYTTPSLLEYGSVAKLTQGSGGTLVDGNNTRTKNNPMLISPSNTNSPKKMR